MSMQSWTEEGFGVPLFTEHNEEKVFRFIAEHSPEYGTVDDFRKAMEEGWYAFDFWDNLGDPASWIVADIINRLEGTTIFKGYVSCGDTDQEEMIGIEPCFPWTMNEKDRSLTSLQAHELMEKYAAILGIKEPPDYFEAYYFG